MGEEGFDKAPLLIKVSGEPEQVHGIVRTGTLWSAMAHIITAVIGSGVLSLAWSVGQLGWIGGPTAIVTLAAITVVQSGLLADCYKSPDPECGPLRHRSYMEAVRHYLGERCVWVCGLFQQSGLYGCAVAYTLTSATSMRYALCVCHKINFFFRNIPNRKNKCGIIHPQSSFRYFFIYFLLWKTSLKYKF